MTEYLERAVKSAEAVVLSIVRTSAVNLLQASEVLQHVEGIGFQLGNKNGCVSRGGTVEEHSELEAERDVEVELVVIGLEDLKHLTRLRGVG